MFQFIGQEIQVLWPAGLIDDEYEHNSYGGDHSQYRKDFPFISKQSVTFSDSPVDVFRLHVHLECFLVPGFGRSKDLNFEKIICMLKVIPEFLLLRAQVVFIFMMCHNMSIDSETLANHHVPVILTLRHSCIR